MREYHFIVSGLEFTVWAYSYEDALAHYDFREGSIERAWVAI